MLLFWSRNNPAELWVGSHNWTNRAIFGLNVEASLVVELRDSSRLFCDAAEYLQKIKGICEVFDLSKIESGTVSVEAEEVFFGSLIEMVARPLPSRRRSPSRTVRDVA